MTDKLDLTKLNPEANEALVKVLELAIRSFLQQHVGPPGTVDPEVVIAPLIRVVIDHINCNVECEACRVHYCIKIANTFLKPWGMPTLAVSIEGLHQHAQTAEGESHVLPVDLNVIPFPKGKLH